MENIGSRIVNISRRRAASCIAASVVVVFSLAGCVSFSRQVQEHTLAYNFAQEDIANQTFLLNALRARDGRPMHFTTLSKVTGKLAFSSDGTLTVPFGENIGSGIAVNSVVSGFSVSSSPSFDVVPENKSVFMRGITTPITLELFSRYWHQGWPKDLLVHLLIRKIEVVTTAPPHSEEPSRPIRVFVNAPDAPDAARETCTRGVLVDGSFVDRAAYPVGADNSARAVPAFRVSTNVNDVTFDADHPLEIDPNEMQTDWCRYEMFKFFVDLYLPRLRLFEGRPEETLLRVDKKALSVDDLATIVSFSAQPGVNMERDDDKLLVKLAQSRSIAVCIVESEDVENVPADASAAEADEYCPPGALDQISGAANAFSFVQEAQKESASVTVTAHFRSPQGILFYLGEVLKAYRGGQTVCVASGKSESLACPFGEVPLFVARAADDPGEVSVPYRDGKTYAVPVKDAGFSMAALSLLTQIFALSRDAGELPSTSTVNVLN